MKVKKTIGRKVNYNYKNSKQQIKFVGIMGCVKTNRATVIVGQKYGRLTILEDLGSRLHHGNHVTFVRTKCDCGNEHTIPLTVLKGGGSRSCGCLRREMAKEWSMVRLKRHGLGSHPLMRVWDAMIQRCYNPNSKCYKNYGGRGVVVCQEWREYIIFYRWAVENGWQEGLQLDKDIRGDGFLYSPSTCSFVTRFVNNRNTRRNVNIEYNGEVRCITDWAAQIGISVQALKFRLRKWGQMDRVFNTPKSEKYK